jgi:hypothetical protein
MILDNTPSSPLFCQAGRGEGVMGLAIHSGVALLRIAALPGFAPSQLRRLGPAGRPPLTQGNDEHD